MKAYRQCCEDYIAVIHDGSRTVIVVADGAGGVGSGDIAAKTVVREVSADYSQMETAEHWQAKLRQIDLQIDTGESTAVVADLRPEGVCGASVGDSQAWIVRYSEITDLTSQQHRKPLLGSREAAPVGFSYPPLQGILLAATDGFFNYAPRKKIASLIERSDFYEIPRQCVEMVRLGSGELWDDVGVVACRVKPRSTSRKRYVL